MAIAEEAIVLEHQHIGPTWVKTEDGSWLLPERTLGWEIAGWCSTFLLDPEGKPWKFTLEQLRLLLWWYAVDENGEFVYRTGVIQRMKGWGKDPFLAVICLVEFVGPSRFSHWAEDGSPVGKPHPAAWVQITAVSQEQTSNTMALMPSLISEHMKRTYGIKDGIELIRANNGRQRIQAVTSSYRAIEGKRTTFTVLNETHHWVVGNGGIKMFETIDGNAFKMNARYLSITNAYLPGEDSVAENQRASWENIESGKAADVKFLYDSIEADPRTPLTVEGLRDALPVIRGDAIWLNVESIILSVQNTSIAAARSRRMWLNQIVAEEDALYDPAQIRAIEDDDAVLLAGDEIVMGFDGGKTDDATVLIALRLKDKCAFVLHLQEKPLGPEGDGWMVNRERVDAAVHDAFRTYDVKGFFADVALWESYIDSWAEEYGEGLEVKASGVHPIAWDMRRSQQTVTRAHERLMQSIFDAVLRFSTLHTGLRRHTLNAKRKENNYGISFTKESRESPRKVDAYAALMLAHEAMHQLRTRVSAPKRERTGTGWFF